MGVKGLTMNKEIKHLSSTLVSSLTSAQAEKDVENAYRKAFDTLYPATTTSPMHVDGLLKADNLHVMMEFKFGKEFSNGLVYAATVVQALYYLKGLALEGSALPTGLFFGDENECFCLSTKTIAKYLNEKIDWSVAPSSAASVNPGLVATIAQDSEVCPFVYTVNEKFDFLAVVERLKLICQDKPCAVVVTSKNIPTVYQLFVSHVFKDKKAGDAECVDAFITSLISPEDAYIHPVKANTLVCHGKNYKVNVGKFRAFFQTFKQKYSVEEIEDITGSKDRILENSYRRRTGAFFTPNIWVAEAHKLLAETLGADWKEKFVVWDCACGTANLTRGYKFSELYLSTLDESDVQTIKDCGYNTEAGLFQYDFLSEMTLGSKIPEGLRKAFESGKQVLFLINPPYGTACSGGANVQHKAGLADTWMNGEMKKAGLGACRQQLYAQFLYRVSQLKQQYGNRVSLACFAPPLYMTGPSFEKFRSSYYSNMHFRAGMLFQASEFADVASQWGISFTIWNSDGNNDNINLAVKEFSEATMQIEKTGDKFLYTATGKEASAWVREGLVGKPEDAPQMSSATNVLQEGCLCGNLIPGALGYMNNGGNNTYQNATKVGLYSSAYANAHGFSIQPSNFFRAMALFCARKAVQPDWINCKDEYLVPNVEHPDYHQWNNDAVVYALFNVSSNQSSLRNVEYKGKKWDIQNQFFFMSNKEMAELANEHGFVEMYNDAKTFNQESYVFKLLETMELSADARAVLTAARELVRKTMAMRKLYSEEHPECHLQSWSAGWAQLKPMMKEHFKDDYDKFRTIYGAFECRMHQGVNKFGWLK